MLKRLMLTCMTVLLPIIVIFTVYRASLGYGPLNFKGVLGLFQSSFGNLRVTLDLFYKELQTLLARIEDYDLMEVIGGFPSNMTWLDRLRYTAVDYLFYVRRNVEQVRDLFFLFIRLIKVFLQDFVDLMYIITTFLVKGSPYKSFFYYPVG